MTLIAPLSTGKVLDDAKIELRPMGDRAILLRLMLPPGLPSAAALTPAQRYNRMLAARLLSVFLQDHVSAEPGWPREFVPGYDNVLAPFDPDLLPQKVFVEWLSWQLETVVTDWESGGLPDAGSPRLHRLPVVYGGKYGPDLEKLAQRHSLTPDEVVKIHSTAEYSVYLGGFAPGFAYLGALPPAIDAPRLKNPRPSVPGGTVALAAGLTGVYPMASQPGGWNLVGYTPFALFDATQNPPVRFLPGDRVQFYPVEETALPGLREAGASLAPVKLASEAN